MNSTLYCKICFQNLPQDAFINLTCQHYFCRQCLVALWTDNIKSKMIDETIIKCPEEECNTPINYYILKRTLSLEIFEEYDKRKMGSVVVTEKNKERTISCPKCNILNFIWIEADYFTCPSCNEKFCSKENCLGDWERHQNINCFQFQKKYDINGVRLQILQKEKGWCACPVCASVIEKTGNCNKIRCESTRCQKKTLFCYLCGQKLEENKVGIHFPKGEFSKECVGIEKNQENGWQNEERETLKKYKETEKPMNSIPD